MEFKGTKKKWELSENGGLYDTTNSGIICDLITSSQKDKADALLISKAPEMLELLQSLVSSEMTPLTIRKQAKQLIKEATEF